MEIHWVGLQEIEDRVRTDIEKRLEKLASSHRDLIDLRISGRQIGHHHHDDKEVRITCQARGREILAARTASEFQPALKEALDAFQREVHQLREKRRDATRHPGRSGT